MFNLLSTRTPRSFSSKLFPNWVATSMHWCLGLFFSTWRTLHCSWLKFMRFLSAHFSSLFMSLGMAAWPSGISATLPSFVSPANLLRVHCPVIQVVNEDLNRTGPSVDPWGTLLVTGLQQDFIPLITTLQGLLLGQFSIHLNFLHVLFTCREHEFTRSCFHLSSPDDLLAAKQMIYEQM